ncbi:MAG: MCP four helix bundle domain-containing protein [Lachnospiraceae bacterium]|nr:MCP four helix bundle domain-containing protein [Lachnospiraceae bacterium]
MKLFRNLKVKQKITLSFTLGNVLLLLCILVLEIFLHNTARNYEDMYNNYGAPMATAGRVGIEFFSASGDLEELLFTEDAAKAERVLKEYETGRELTLKDLGELDLQIVDGDVRQDFAKLSGLINNVIAGQDEVVALIRSGDKAAAGKLYEEKNFDEAEAEVIAAVNKLDNTFQIHVASTMGSNQNRVNALIIGSLIVTAVACAFIVFIGISLGKEIRVPIQKLQNVAKTMAGGDVNVEIDYHSKDEIGQLADDLRDMTDTIKEQAEALEKMSRGDLTAEIVPKGSSDLMGRSLKSLVDMENRTLKGIRAAVGEVHIGSNQVSSASQALAQGSTEQASAIQQITASMNDITEKTRVNAEEAGEAYQLVTKAKESAMLGNERMKGMISAMEAINESSENISKIIKVIDDIAFQTNILALNAAVEAARAGQHGKGFAVVAEEVRNLAGKSAQAANETAELIEDSITKVAKGSQFAHETESALLEIVSAIDRIVELTNLIATASDEQAISISQIDQALGQVSQVVQTNSATSEQCAAASEELSGQAEKLKDMIAHYRLKAGVQEAGAAGRGKTKGYTEADEGDDYGENYSAEDGYPDDEEERPAPRAKRMDGKKPVISLEDDFGKY